MNLEHLEDDTIPEIAIGIKVQKKKKSDNKLKVIVLNPSFGDIKPRVVRRLQEVDNHHLNFAISIINSQKLKHIPVVKKLKTVPKLCVNCLSCIRALNHCSVYNQDCSSIEKSSIIKKCSFKREIKGPYGKNKNNV